MAKVLTLVFLLLAVVVCSVRDSRAQTTAFTYQGSLKNGGSPASGNFDFQFKLFDMIAGGAQQGSTLQLQNVSVTNGVFTVSLDFGAGTLPGADRFLDIAVRTSGGGAFTPLAPRLPLSSTPYSVRSLNAATADSLSSSGSGNFIQNSTSQQTASFNITGDGTAGGMLAGNIVRAGTEFQIGEARILGADIATANTFVGIGAGVSNTSGDQNTFVGRGTGPGNLTGNNNTFVGAAAGNANMGSNNTAVGRFSGLSITTGSNNTLIGANSNVSSPTLSYAAAIGSDAVVGTNNTIVIGRSGGQDTVQIPGNLTVNGTLNATLPAGSGNYIQNQTLNPQSAGFNVSGNGIVGGNLGVGSVPFGILAKLHVSGSGVVRARVESNTDAGLSLALGTAPRWSVATTTGGWFQIINDSNSTNAFWIDSSNDNVGIGTTPSDKLHVAGIIRVNLLGSAGLQQLCTNASNQISICSSSLRYKTNIAPLASGLSLINQLRPISFDWKQGGMRDVGLGAEDVAKIDPLFVTYNDKGEIEGVKYDRISVVLVNAIKEQQAQIESQQKLIEEQQIQINELKKLVCAHNLTADICKPSPN